MRDTNNGTMPGFATPNEKALGAANSKGLMNDTNSEDFTSHGPVNHAHGGNTVALPDLALTITATEARIDSRLLAHGFGNKHRHSFKLIEKYRDKLERFGKVSFKNSPLPDSKTGQSERYALLNEDQAYLLLSLSRNSATVVDLKVKLVKAFGDARRAADLRKTDYLPTYHDLHERIGALAAGSPNEQHIHANFNKLINKFAGIKAGHRASAAVPQQALLIVAQMAAASAVRGASNHRDGYQSIKATLQALQGAIALEAPHE